MSQVLDTLVSLLKLKKIDDAHFCGDCEDLGLPQVFGGQIVGQALSAAAQSVPQERLIHSLHSYFLRPARSEMPIEYLVENLRDGGSFSTRRVTAMQNDVTLFNMTASFQEVSDGFEHQNAMPDVPGPENLISETVFAEKLAHYLPEKFRDAFTGERALEMRPVTFHNPLKGEVAEPVRYVWFKANGTLPDDLTIHQSLLGYASDFHFLPTALQAHGIAFLDPTMQIATIDHAMWFHRPFRCDQWLLYAVENCSNSQGRGYVRGHFFTQDGRLVASCTQEGIIRRHKK